MSEKQPPGDLSGEFGIVLDEDLIAAALTAVSRTGRKGGGSEVSALGDEAEAGESIDAEAEVEVELDLDMNAPPAPRRVEVDPRVAAGEMAIERLRLADQEIARLRGAQRRLEEQLQRAETAASDALAARRAAEEGASALKRRIEALEADLGRLRERRVRDLDEQRKFGHSRTVESLLPVMDNLELALQHRQADAEVLTRGVQIILEQFHQALQQVGLKRIIAGEGTLFEPALHEAVSEELTEELLPGLIVRELRPGYTLNGRMLRAARVIVAGQPAGLEGESTDRTGLDRPAEQVDPAVVDGETADQDPPGSPLMDEA